MDYKKFIEAKTNELLIITDAKSAFRREGKRWSRKEILGHLIDSASNNHKRFVEAQFRDDLLFSGYEQDNWVEAQKYQSKDWKSLIRLWKELNLHLIHLISFIPDEQKTKLRLRHNLDKIAWKTVFAERPATLEYFIDDYFGHLEHHLKQIFEYEQN